MNDTNAEHFQSTVSDAIKLTEIYSSRIAKSRDNKTNISSQTMITRILTAHPEAFEALKNMHNGELRSRMRNNKKTPGILYMIVGFKTCVDADMSSYSKQVKEASADIQIPVDKILLALGLPLTFGADLGAATTLKRVQEHLSKHIATGERSFAVQYRQITTETTWKLRKNNMLGNYATVQAGLLGEDDDKKDRQEDTDGELTKTAGERNDKQESQDDEMGLRKSMTMTRTQ